MSPDVWLSSSVTVGIFLLSSGGKILYDRGVAAALEAARLKREAEHDILWDRRHDDHGRKLDAIETHTAQINGTVGKHDTTLMIYGQEIARLRDEPRCQDCNNFKERRSRRKPAKEG